MTTPTIMSKDTNKKTRYIFKRRVPRAMFDKADGMYLLKPPIFIPGNNNSSVRRKVVRETIHSLIESMPIDVLCKVFNVEELYLDDMSKLGEVIFRVSIDVEDD